MPSIAVSGGNAIVIREYFCGLNPRLAQMWLFANDLRRELRCAKSYLASVFDCDDAPYALT